MNWWSRSSSSFTIYAYYGDDIFADLRIVVHPDHPDFEAALDRIEAYRADNGRPDNYMSELYSAVSGALQTVDAHRGAVWRRAQAALVNLLTKVDDLSERLLARHTTTMGRRMVDVRPLLQAPSERRASSWIRRLRPRSLPRGLYSLRP